MSDKASRELTPADVKLLEPDVLGALALVLHGRDERPDGRPAPLPSPAGWRGLGRRRRS
jgi:hypothetical protein